MFLSTAISAQVITNHSFEDGTNPGSFATVNAGDVTIDGWIVDAGSVDYIGNYWLASDGSRSVDLNGFYAKAAISQSITGTIPGVTYEVTFDLSGNPDGDPVTKSVTVGVNGNAATESIFTYTVNPFVNAHDNMLYASNTYYFVATSANTVLRFTSNTNFLDGNASAFGPVLDNVAMAPITAQICHLDSGKRTKKTIIVGLSAIAAHIAHGDPSPAGPCTAS